jgi:hypothetical protein
MLLSSDPDHTVGTLYSEVGDLAREETVPDVVPKCVHCLSQLWQVAWVTVVGMVGWVTAAWGNPLSRQRCEEQLLTVSQ